MRRIFELTLVLAAGACLSIPPAGAQGFDLGFDAVPSAGATGQKYYTTENTWQDVEHMAPRGNSTPGVGQTYDTGSQGWNDINGARLPETAAAVIAPASGFAGQACGSAGNGGFKGGGARRFMGASNSFMRTGAVLPATATSLVDLNVVAPGRAPGP